MKHKILIFLILLLLICIRQGIRADERKTASSLGTVVVSARASEGSNQTGDVSKEESSTFYSEIKRDEFEGKFENLSEVLKKEAGIQVLQTSGLGSYSTVFIRGSSSKHVLVYMDGILLNDASGGLVDLSSISLSDVESIEIYRGFAPINFGKAYAGGVINIRTRRSKPGLNFSVLGGYGSFNSQKYSAYLNYKPNLMDMLINADVMKSDNNYPYLNVKAPLNLNDDVVEERNNNQFIQTNVLAKFGFDITKKIRLELFNNFFYKNQGIPPNNNSVVGKPFLETKRNMSQIKLIADDLGKKAHINTAGHFFFVFSDEHYQDLGGGGHVGIGEQDNKYRNISYGYNHFLEWPTRYNVLTVTADIKREDYELEDLKENEEYAPSYRNSYAIGIEDSIILLNETLIIKPLFRYMYVLDKLETGVDAHGNFVEPMRRSKHYFSPQIGIKYSIVKWFSLKGNFARYVREPTFFELFGDRGHFLGEVDLKPEVGYNYDAGFEILYKRKKKTGSKNLFKRFSFFAAYFRSDIEDVIVHTYDARGIGRPDNIAEAHINGVETGFVLDCLRYIRLSSNYTWQHTTTKNKFKDLNNKKLPGRFEHAYFGKLELITKWFKLYYEFTFNKNMYYDGPNILPADDMMDHTAGISATGFGFTLTFEVKNIGNQIHKDFYRLQSPGRAYYFTLKFAFDKDTYKDTYLINKKEESKTEIKGQH